MPPNLLPLSNPNYDMKSFHTKCVALVFFFSFNMSQAVTCLFKKDKQQTKQESLETIF